MRKNIVRRTLADSMAVLLVVVMCFAVSGCGSSDKMVETTKPTTAESAEKSTVAETESSGEGEINYSVKEGETALVYDAVNYYGAYDEDDPNAAKTYDEEIGEFVSEKLIYHIPYVNLKDGKGDKINDRIYNDLFLEYAQTKYAERVDFLWSEKDDVVSVLTACFFGYPGLSYRTFNVSKTTGELLDNKALAQMYSLSEDELYALAKERMESFFRNKYKEIDEAGEWGDMYKEQLTRTVADENVREIDLYINEEGDLCATATIYSMAGAGSYSHVINLTGEKIQAEDPKLDFED